MEGSLPQSRCARRKGRAAVRGTARRGTLEGGRPEALARRYRDEGAARLHVVDLDGAFDGSPRPRSCGGGDEPPIQMAATGRSRRSRRHSKRRRPRHGAGGARPHLLDRAWRGDALIVAVDSPRDGMVTATAGRRLPQRPPPEHAARCAKRSESRASWSRAPAATLAPRGPTSTFATRRGGRAPGHRGGRRRVTRRPRRRPRPRLRGRIAGSALLAGRFSAPRQADRRLSGGRGRCRRRSVTSLPTTATRAGFSWLVDEPMVHVLAADGPRLGLVNPVRHEPQFPRAGARRASSGSPAPRPPQPGLCRCRPRAGRPRPSRSARPAGTPFEPITVRESRRWHDSVRSGHEDARRVAEAVSGSFGRGATGWPRPAPAAHTAARGARARARHLLRVSREGLHGPSEQHWHAPAQGSPPRPVRLVRAGRTWRRR